MILCIQHVTKMQCIRKHNMNPYDAIRPEYSVLHLYCTWLAWVKHKYHMHFSFQYLQSTMVLTARLQKNKNMFFCPANCPNKSNAFSHHLPAQRVLWLCEAGFATKRLILILIGHLGDQRESVSEKIHGPCKAYDKLSRIAGWWLVVFTILKNISQWDGLSHILWKIKNVWNILKPPTRLFFLHGFWGCWRLCSKSSVWTRPFCLCLFRKVCSNRSKAQDVVGEQLVFTWLSEHGRGKHDPGQGFWRMPRGAQLVKKYGILCIISRLA